MLAAGAGIGPITVLLGIIAFALLCLGISLILFGWKK